MPHFVTAHYASLIPADQWQFRKGYRARLPYFNAIPDRELHAGLMTLEPRKVKVYDRLEDDIGLGSFAWSLGFSFAKSEEHHHVDRLFRS